MSKNVKPKQLTRDEAMRMHKVASAAIAAYALADQRATNQALLGRFFRAGNRDSGNDETWTKYFAWLRLDEDGWLVGWTFEKNRHGIITIETDKRTSVMHLGLVEITHAEFLKAYGAEVLAQLPKA
jgi:hypothetical protein